MDANHELAIKWLGEAAKGGLPEAAFALYELNETKLRNEIRMRNRLKTSIPPSDSKTPAPSNMQSFPPLPAPASSPITVAADKSCTAVAAEQKEAAFPVIPVEELPKPVVAIGAATKNPQDKSPGKVPTTTGSKQKLRIQLKPPPKTSGIGGKQCLHHSPPATSTSSSAPSLTATPPQPQ